MSLPAPAAVLRHRPPALFLGSVETFSGNALACSSPHAGPWRWPELLEGTAQAAGLLAGLQTDGPANTAVIAEYRGVVVHAAGHDGPVHFLARLERRLLHFWCCRVEARDAGGRVLLEGAVTVAPG